MAKYLSNIPEEASLWGASKVLTVRRESIHLKHILTEVFVRKSVILPIDVFEYMEYITNQFRKIYTISRDVDLDPNTVVNVSSQQKFFPYLEILKPFKTLIVLDFDGVVTDRSFEDLYKLCISRCETCICSANPCIEKEYFIKRDLPLPSKIYSMRGSDQKRVQLLELNRYYDFVLYVDNEIKYLEYAWLFGIHTYHWCNKKIVHYTRNT